MNHTKNIIIAGQQGKPMLTDIFYLHTSRKKPVVIYSHGFNGFKDWGHFDLIAQQFASAGFVFIKFNFSHNGTTIDHPEDFADLEAYGNNNYTKELDDLGLILDWATSNGDYASQTDESRVYLLGHSLGGGISLLKAAEDIRVGALATWASVAECQTPWANWPEAKLNEWKDSGVACTTNSRTKQDLPLYYQLYEDYQQHKERLDIQKAISGLKIPVLLCHGLQDPAVPVEKAYSLHKWQPASELFLVESDHVFGRKHPWTKPMLPVPMQQVVDKTISFFKSQG